MRLRENDVIGHIADVNGNVFTLAEIDDSNYIEKRLFKKVLSGGINLDNRELVLLNGDSKISPDEAIKIKFVFTDQNIAFCTKFLDFFAIDARISCFCMYSKLNKNMIELILNRTLSKMILKSLVEYQDLFEYKDFINKLDLEYKFIFFTENIHRTTENMARYRKDIKDIIIKILSDNVLLDKEKFGFKEIDLLEDVSEFKVLLYKMDDNYFNDDFNFTECEDEVKKMIAEEAKNRQEHIDDLKYIVDSISKNTDLSLSRERMLDKFSNEYMEAVEENKRLLSRIDSMSDIFNE